MSDEPRPPGITALSMLFVFGAVTTGIMAALVLFPGDVDTPSTQHASPIMITIGLLLMIAACIACIAAAIGLWRCALWGMWTSLVILCANVLSEFTDLITTRDWRTLIGFSLSGLLIWYLWSKKPMFERSAQAALQQNEDQAARTSA